METGCRPTTIITITIIIISVIVNYNCSSILSLTFYRTNIILVLFSITHRIKYYIYD